MKEKFQEQLKRISDSHFLDMEALSNVHRVSKVLIKKFKPEYLKDIDALNPHPDESNHTGIKHTRNNLKGILDAIIVEYDIEENTPKAPIIIPHNIEKLLNKEDVFWRHIHPVVKKLCQKKFKDGHYADAVETALKELNDIVKEYVKKKTGEEYDGSELMQKAFSLNNPVVSLDDLSTENGKNIQKGYMQIFAGAMTGIRNPKTHKNVVITSERAIQLLFFCSLLFYKLEDGKVI